MGNCNTEKIIERIDKDEFSETQTEENFQTNLKDIPDKKYFFWPHEKQTLLWITESSDSEVDSTIKKYKDYFKDFQGNDLDFKAAESVKEAFDFLRKCYFELVYVIIDFPLFPDWAEQYLKNLSKLRCFCASVVISKDPSKEKNYYINNKFADPGGVVKTMKEALKYIQKDECNWKSKPTLKMNEFMIAKPDLRMNDYMMTKLLDIPKGKEFEFTVKNIHKSAELFKYLLYSKILNKKEIYEEEIKNFMDYCFKFKESHINALAKPSLEKDLKLPLIVLAKYYFLMYNAESTIKDDFTKNLNEPKIMKNYSVFLKLLYFGLKEGLFKSFGKQKLFKGEILSEEQFDKIKKCFSEKGKKAKADENEEDAALFYQKDFTLYSKEEKRVNKYLKNAFNNEDPNSVKVKFIINPIQTEDLNGFLLTNIEMDAVKLINKTIKSKEVLFLPMSLFDIVDVREEEIEVNGNKEKIKVIELSYLNQYEERIKNYLENLKNEERLPDIEKFKKNCLGDDLGDYFGNDLRGELKSNFVLENHEEFKNIGSNIIDKIAKGEELEPRKPKEQSVVKKIGTFIKEKIAKGEEKEPNESKEPMEPNQSKEPTERDLKTAKIKTVNSGFSPNKNHILWIMDKKESEDSYDKTDLEFLEKNQEFFRSNKYYFLKAESVDDAIKKLNNCIFEMVYLIVDAPLFSEWVERYKNIWIKLKCYCATIVYSKDPDFTHRKLNDSFYNPGRMVTEYPKIIEYIKTDYCKWETITKNAENPCDFKGKGFDLFVKNITDLSEISSYLLFSKSVTKEKIDEKELEKFRDYIFSYDCPKYNVLVQPTKEKSIRVPLELLSKFFIFLYSQENKKRNFYSEMNQMLTHPENLQYFNPFVYLLYYGLIEGVYQPCNNEKLFRGQKLSNEHFEKFKQCLEVKQAREKEEKEKDLTNSKEKINAALFCSQSFLSFSKEEKISNDFIIRGMKKLKKGEEIQVKFIVNPISGYENHLTSNIDVDACKLSALENEKEVLFLPFSCFDVVSIKEEKIQNQKKDVIPVTVIELNYLEDYEAKLDNYLKEIKKEGQAEKYEDFMSKTVNAGMLKDFKKYFSSGENGANLSQGLENAIDNKYEKKEKPIIKKNYFDLEIKEEEKEEEEGINRKEGEEEKEEEKEEEVIPEPKFAKKEPKNQFKELVLRLKPIDNRRIPYLTWKMKSDNILLNEYHKPKNPLKELILRVKPVDNRNIPYIEWKKNCIIEAPKEEQEQKNPLKELVLRVKPIDNRGIPYALWKNNAKTKVPAPKTTLKELLLRLKPTDNRQVLFKKWYENSQPIYENALANQKEEKGLIENADKKKEQLSFKKLEKDAIGDEEQHLRDKLNAQEKELTKLRAFKEKMMSEHPELVKSMGMVDNEEEDI